MCILATYIPPVQEHNTKICCFPFVYFILINSVTATYWYHKLITTGPMHLTGVCLKLCTMFQKNITLLFLEQDVQEATAICPRPLQVDLLALKVVSKSRVTWATSVQIFVFLGLSVLDLGPMYATDRRQTSRQTSDAHHRLMLLP